MLTALALLALGQCYANANANVGAAVSLQGYAATAVAQPVVVQRLVAVPVQVAVQAQTYQLQTRAVVAAPAQVANYGANVGVGVGANYGASVGLGVGVGSGVGTTVTTDGASRIKIRPARRGLFRRPN